MFPRIRGKLSFFQRESASIAKDRRHRRGLLFEPLEQRELLVATAGSLAIGAGADFVDYYTTSPLFVDVMKETNDGWNVVDAAHPASPFSISGVPEPQMDSNGYPIGLGNLPSQGYALDTFVFTNNGSHYPIGTYTLTFDGDGTVGICNANQQMQTFSQSGGTGSPSNVYINSTGGSGILIVILSSSSSDYVRNIRLVMPGFQNTYTTQPFNPAVISEFQPLQDIRTLDLMDINSATQNVGITWAEETPETYRTQAKSTGVSVQYLVALANATQDNLWITVPVGADSTYLTNFSQYVEQNLDSNLDVYLEYGNEVWNTNYSNEYNYVLNYAKSNGLNFPKATAVLATATWNVWLQSFAGQTNRVFRVVANQTSVPTNVNQEIAELVQIASPSDPHHGFDMVAGTAYFGPNTSSYNAQTTVQQIELDSMADLPTMQSILDSYLSVVNSWSTTLNEQIPVFLYEGGMFITTTSTTVPWYSAFLQAQTDPGMYAVFSAFLDDLQSDGLVGINLTNLSWQSCQYGEWGVMNYVEEPQNLTPKYDAVLDFLASEEPSLSLSNPPSTVAAGTATSFTVTAYDQNGNVETGYRGTVSFTSTDPQATLPANYTFTSQDQGQHTFSITMGTVGIQGFNVTDATNGLVAVNWGISVTPGQAASMEIFGYPTSVGAGKSQSGYLYVFDSYGNLATNYTGTVAFTSSDKQAALPANYTFTSSNAGITQFSATLRTAGTQSITATDTSNSSVTATVSGITVTPAAAHTLTLTGFPTPIQAGTTGSFTVTAYDVWGNVATGYTGTVKFATNDKKASLPANYTFQSSDQGTHTFSATLDTAAVVYLQVNDTSNSSLWAYQTNISVRPGMAVTLAVAGFPNPATIGVLYYAPTVTVYDSYGNIATGYTGTVGFTSSDPKAKLPANYTFTSSDKGQHTFSVALETLGVQSITATDQSNSSLTGTQSGITVQNKSTYKLAIIGLPASPQAGTSYSITVTAYDAAGSVAVGYSGTVGFSSTDDLAILPLSYAFTSGDMGTHRFTVLFNSKGTTKLRVFDTSNENSENTATVLVS